MKLPNFFHSEQLNHIKRKMGIPREYLGPDVSIHIENRKPEPNEIVVISNTGKDVNYQELTFLDDGTIAYKDMRVLVYIRDVGNYGALPKFHFAHCKKLEDMYKNDKIDKYVAFNGLKGLFTLNIHNGYGIESVERRLDVCKFCLNHLHYDGYSSFSSSDRVKKQIVDRFSIADFFERYPTSLIKIKPKYTAETAPTNFYTDNWDDISANYKQSVGWTCEKCGVVLKDSRQRQYLETHHRNGMKSDNTRSNLMALCIRCHAEQPNHSHIRNNPKYIEFIALKNA